MSILPNQENGLNVHGRTVRIKDELYFSPKAVAKSLGVSESSLKRWCDAGRINAIKTAGGHRRLTRADVIAFVKKKKQPFSDPQILGLPDLSTTRISSAADGANQFLEAIIAGDEDRCRRLIIYLFINGWETHDIFDQVVSPAFEEVGRRWQKGELEIYVERRGCEISLNVFRELRNLIPSPKPGGPIAIGGTPPNDHYMLPTSAVEITLRSLGWDARSLGSNLPFSTIIEAINNYRPVLVWLSISHVQDATELLQNINAVSNRFSGNPTFVIGGNAINEVIRDRIQNAVCCSNLSQLVAAVGRIDLSAFQARQPSTPGSPLPDNSNQSL